MSPQLITIEYICGTCLTPHDMTITPKMWEGVGYDLLAAHVEVTDRDYCRVCHSCNFRFEEGLHDEKL